MQAELYNVLNEVAPRFGLVLNEPKIKVVNDITGSTVLIPRQTKKFHYDSPVFTVSSQLIPFARGLFAHECGHLFLHNETPFQEFIQSLALEVLENSYNYFVPRIQRIEEIRKQQLFKAALLGIGPVLSRYLLYKPAVAVYKAYEAKVDEVAYSRGFGDDLEVLNFWIGLHGIEPQGIKKGYFPPPGQQ